MYRYDTVLGKTLIFINFVPVLVKLTLHSTQYSIRSKIFPSFFALNVALCFFLLFFCSFVPFHTLSTDQMYISENASSPDSLLIGTIFYINFLYTIQLQYIPTDSFSPPHTESTRRFWIYKFSCCVRFRLWTGWPRASVAPGRPQWPVVFNLPVAAGQLSYSSRGRGSSRRRANSPS